MGAEKPLDLAARLQIPIKQQRLIKKCLELQKIIESQAIAERCLGWAPSEWCKTIEKNEIPPEAVALATCQGTKNWQPLLRWWSRWRFIKSNVSAEMLIRQGWRPGPELGKELTRLRLERIDNEINPKPLLSQTNNPH